MPEVSNCEVYKLRSKVEELKTVIKRMEEQLEQFTEPEPMLDVDEMDAVRAMATRRG